MNPLSPIAEALLVVAAAILSGLAFCTLIAGAWINIHRHHEADAPPFPPVEELEIPPDREFTDPLRSSRHSVGSENSVLSPQSSPDSVLSVPSVVKNRNPQSSSFPHDTAYDFQNPKRF